jgi:DNA repair protein SbcD/Mre11
MGAFYLSRYNCDVPQPAEKIRLLHFADVHLGVETHGKFNPETGLNTRLEDFKNSLDQGISLALDADIDLAIFAGDAYKARDPSQTHQKLFAASLRRLTDAGIPVVMLVGNHDIPNTRGRAHALEIYDVLGGAGVQILSRPELIPIQTRRGEVLVGGMPYLPRARVLTQDETKNKTVEEIAQLIRDKYIEYIASLARQAAEYPEHIALLTAHFTVADSRVGVQGVLLNAAEPQVPVSALALPQFDYVALGHIHKRQDCNNRRQPPVVYCGSIDRLDFGEKDENKGVVLADISKQNAEFRYVDVDVRTFLEIAIDATDADEPTEKILDELAKRPLKDAVVKLSYKVPREKAPLVREDELRKALAEAHSVVAISRDLPGQTLTTRAEGLTEQLTPEQALTLYLDTRRPDLAPLREDFMAAARRLMDDLRQEALA